MPRRCAAHTRLCREEVRGFLDAFDEGEVRSCRRDAEECSAAVGPGVSLQRAVVRSCGVLRWSRDLVLDLEEPKYERVIGPQLRGKLSHVCERTDESFGDADVVQGAKAMRRGRAMVPSRVGRKQEIFEHIDGFV